MVIGWFLQCVKVFADSVRSAEVGNPDETHQERPMLKLSSQSFYLAAKLPLVRQSISPL
jgi:hypothetical protein